MEDLDNKGGLPRRRALDLSLTQVAASALAAVGGAVLASQLGVYGTILGAAVVSAGATTGTAVFQHVFRRTGEQLREFTTTPVPVEHAQPALRSASAEETQVFDPFDPGGERTRMMARINPPEQGEAVAVYRGRSNLKPKSWKVYAVTAAIVFALAMATVGVIELAAGKPASHLFDGGSSGRPGGGTSAPADPSSGASTGRTGGTSGTSGTGGVKDAKDGKDAGRATPDPGASAAPDPAASSSPQPAPSDPTATPHASTGTSGAGSSGTGGSGADTTGAGSGAASGTSGDAAVAPRSAASP